MANGPAPSSLPRIERVMVDGQAGWLKRPEQLNTRMRLQKGDSNAAFLAEKEAYRRLNSLGLPVPGLLDEGDDFFVTEDSGPILITLMRDHGIDDERFQNAVNAAAETLGQFHAMGFSHGRPALKDICWDGEKATFIDLERISPERDNLKGHGQDVLVFFFSLIAETGGVGPGVLAARKRYRDKDTLGVWQDAQRQARNLRILSVFLWPIIRLLRHKREFGAIYPLLKFFSEDT